MVASHLVLWAWFPITLAAVAAQANGNDIGAVGQLLVPGSAAAAVVVSIKMFTARMKQADEAYAAHSKRAAEAHAAERELAAKEHAAHIKNILDAHSASTTMLVARLDKNTEAIYELNRCVRDCNKGGK